MRIAYTRAARRWSVLAQHEAHVEEDGHEHDQHQRDRDGRTIGPVARLQEQVDQRIADEEHFAATQILRAGCSPPSAG